MASQPLTAWGLDDFVARDQRAMGFDRNVLLKEIAGRSGSRMVSLGDAIHRITRLCAESRRFQPAKN